METLFEETTAQKTTSLTLSPLNIENPAIEKSRLQGNLPGTRPLFGAKRTPRKLTVHARKKVKTHLQLDLI